MYRIAHEPPIPPSQFNKAVGPDLTAVLERALAKNPDHRFPTGAQLVSELRRVIVGRPAAPVPAAPTPAVATVVVSPPAPEVSASGGGLAPIPTGAGPAVSQPAPAAPVAAEPDVAPVIPPLAASPARTGRRSRRGLLLGLAAVVVLAGVLAGAVLYFQRPATPLPEAGRTPATTTAGAPVQPATPAVPPAEPPLPATPAVPAASLSTATTPAVTAPSIPVPSTTAPGQPTPPASGPRRRPPAAASPSTAPPPPVPVQAPPTPAQARPPGRQIYGATEVDERPQVVRQTAPIFPASAVRKNVEDVVVLRVLVAADGRAEEIQVLRGSMKDSSFDNAAVMAVQLWKFSPARKAGQPVASWFNVAVPFQMKR
jgi:TonB family protein